MFRIVNHLNLYSIANSSGHSVALCKHLYNSPFSLDVYTSSFIPSLRVVNLIFIVLQVLRRCNINAFISYLLSFTTELRMVQNEKRTQLFNLSVCVCTTASSSSENTTVTVTVGVTDTVDACIHVCVCVLCMSVSG